MGWNQILVAAASVAALAACVTEVESGPDAFGRPPQIAAQTSDAPTAPSHLASLSSGADQSAQPESERPATSYPAFAEVSRDELVTVSWQDLALDSSTEPAAPLTESGEAALRRENSRRSTRIFLFQDRRIRIEGRVLPIASGEAGGSGFLLVPEVDAGLAVALHVEGAEPLPAGTTWAVVVGRLDVQPRTLRLPGQVEVVADYVLEAEAVSTETQEPDAACPDGRSG